MRSKNISFIPVTKRTINCLSSLQFLAPKGRLFRPIWHIGHVRNQTVSWHCRIWHAGCNSLPSWKCLGLYEMPSGYPRHLCRTGKYDARPMRDPCSSSMPTEGQAKSPKASERALDVYVWASVSTPPDRELENEQLTVLFEALSG